jgi:hypothetical protein
MRFASVVGQAKFLMMMEPFVTHVLHLQSLERTTRIAESVMPVKFRTVNKRYALVAIQGMYRIMTQTRVSFVPRLRMPIMKGIVSDVVLGKFQIMNKVGVRVARTMRSLVVITIFAIRVGREKGLLGINQFV